MHSLPLDLKLQPQLIINWVDEMFYNLLNRKTLCPQDYKYISLAIGDAHGYVIE
jgi:hypothetical protein